MNSNHLSSKKCHQKCHGSKEFLGDGRKPMRITQEIVLEAVLEVYREKKRPVHIGDLKEFFDIREKRDSVRAGNWSRIDSIEHAMRKLFKRGLLSRSEEMVRVENYKTSPFALRKKTTANVYFYAPIELAGRTVEFELENQYFSVKFIRYGEISREETKTKKEMVLEVLKSSEKAMTVDEILEEINRKYNAYKITNKKDFYNATSSLLRAVLKPLRKEGLRGIKVDGKWIWYFTEEQLENFKEEYIRKSELLRTARDLVKSERCVPLSRVLSEIAVTVEEAKYHLKRVAKCIEVEIEVHASGSSTEVNVKVPDFKRDSFIDWLGYVVPKSPYGYGYESFLVDLDSDWEEKLKKEIAKSLARINIKAVIGSFYEKLVARLFEIICSKVAENPKLSKFSIPFVFRDEKVTNVWIVTEKGRKLEFDVLIRGTFYPFNVMVDGRCSLDIIMPIECKYTLVKPEHVANFDDRIKAAFGNARNVLPIMIGLGWSNEALHMAKRLGIMTLYFSAIDRLISEMTGKKYRHENEWRRVEEMLNKGEITLKELREKLKKGEWKFEFEKIICRI